MSTRVLTEFSAGDTFEPISITIDAERARAYRAAAGDSLAIYEESGIVPPLAVAAFALGALLEAVNLPPGSLHGSESVEMKGAVPMGGTIECRARLAQRSQRQGWIASALQSDIYHEGRLVLSTRATVLSPAGGAS